MRRSAWSCEAPVRTRRKETLLSAPATWYNPPAWDRTDASGAIYGQEARPAMGPQHGEQEKMSTRALRNLIIGGLVAAFGLTAGLTGNTAAYAAPQSSTGTAASSQHKKAATGKHHQAKSKKHSQKKHHKASKKSAKKHHEKSHGKQHAKAAHQPK